MSQGTTMGVFLKRRGLIEMAIHIEEDGRQAYEYFETRAEDPGLKSLWALLKGEEEAHARFFKSLLKTLPKTEAEQDGGAASDTFARALASSYVFTERRLAKVLTEDLRSDLDALAYGIYIEKESIFAYITLRDHIPPADAPMLDRIVEEEKRHLAKLTARVEGLPRAGSGSVQRDD
jgi:rubrerythrin